MDDNSVYQRMADMRLENEKTVAHYKRLLKDCVNELCSRCGRYRNEHLGACNGCKWKKVRCGDDE